jgi:beige protein homolog 1
VLIHELADGKQCARINDVTGNIMLCRGQRVALYTLNGQLLLDQSVCDTSDDYVVSCAFYEGTGNEWLERDILFTGHKRGIVNVG